VKEFLRIKWPRLANAGCIVLGQMFLMLLVSDWVFTTRYPDAGKMSTYSSSDLVVNGPSESEWLGSHLLVPCLLLLLLLAFWLTSIVRQYRRQVRAGRTLQTHRNYFSQQLPDILIILGVAAGAYSVALFLTWVNHQGFTYYPYDYKPPFWYTDHDGIRWWLRIVVGGTLVAFAINWVVYLFKGPCSVCETMTRDRFRHRFLCYRCMKHFGNDLPALLQAPEWACPNPKCGKTMVERTQPLSRGTVKVRVCESDGLLLLTADNRTQLEQSGYRRGLRAGLKRSLRWRALLPYLDWPPAVLTAMTLVFAVIMTTLQLFT
jgi:hypothetical protein